MKTVTMTFSSALAGAMFALIGTVASGARADGLLARASDLPVAERTKLQSAVAEQRRADPKSFAALRQLKGIRPDVYRQFRNPIPEVGRELRHLGKGMLMPMLEALVLDAPDLSGATDEERQALVDGMLSEVGRLRDPRATAALQVVFSKDQAPGVWRGAARAMGRSCEASSFDRLKGALANGPRRLAAIDGIGECRTLEAARVLGAEIEVATSSSDAASLARAAGNLGSSWAWQALGNARQAEGLQVREVLASALVRGFVRHAGDARAANRAALSMVDHPELGRIVAAQRAGANEATQRELDALVKALDARRVK